MHKYIQNMIYGWFSIFISLYFVVSKKKFSTPNRNYL